VIDEAEIEATGANRVDQILALIANVQLGNGSQGPAIRGLDTTGPLSALPAFLGGNRPRTTLIVDGRPVSYNEFVFGSYPVWDLDRIEVYERADVHAGISRARNPWRLQHAAGLGIGIGPDHRRQSGAARRG
jgi:hypothetical protein